MSVDVIVPFDENGIPGTPITTNVKFASNYITGNIIAKMGKKYYLIGDSYKYYYTEDFETFSMNQKTGSESQDSTSIASDGSSLIYVSGLTSSTMYSRDYKSDGVTFSGQMNAVGSWYMNNDDRTIVLGRGENYSSFYPSSNRVYCFKNGTSSYKTLSYIGFFQNYANGYFILPASDTSSEPMSVTHFVYIQYSSDGETWTKQQIVNTTHAIRSPMFYLPKIRKFVVYSQTGNSYSEKYINLMDDLQRTNLVTKNINISAMPYYNDSRHFQGLVTSSGRLITMQQNYLGLQYSDDGENWTVIALPSGVTNINRLSKIYEDD